MNAIGLHVHIDTRYRRSNNKGIFFKKGIQKGIQNENQKHITFIYQQNIHSVQRHPGLKLPLFDGGRLNANLEGTRAASNMMIERYNQSVLNAVRDVAVNGTRLQTLNDEREMQAERVEATRFTQRAAEAAYQRGLTSRLQATEARLPVLAEEMSLLMLDSRRVIQSIQLMKSLGGGYQAAPVVEKK